ncbi:MAG TPA: PIN domain-containing protein [Terriglobales bacterium]|jgi:tRNA(fMet)-specific endonuclease VapC
MLLLDSSAIITALRQAVRIRSWVSQAALRGEAVATSTIVLFELWYGVMLSRERSRSFAALEAFLAGDITMLPFNAEDAATAAEIRAHLKAAATPIGPFDLLIAAQALRRDATLVSDNLGEFRRIPGLKCIGWSA